MNNHLELPWGERRRAPAYDSAALPRVLGRSDALRLGLSRDAIDRSVAAGRWRRVLPHTYLTVDTITWPDRVAAALAFAGRGAMLSGAAALTFSEMRSVARPNSILVLVPAGNRARSVDWVRVRATSRLPEPDGWYGPRRASVARAVADHALGLRRLDDVRTVVAEVVRRQLCTITEMAANLEAGPRRGSAHFRRALAEVNGGAASAPEARAASALTTAGVPLFEQNARIDLPGGGYYVADFLWREYRAILEIDSEEYHLNPADWRATMDRHLALTTLGYSVVHRPPSAVLQDPERFVTEIRAWLRRRAAECA
jgi:hypothetical protein